jgi:hypothetical protein
MIELNAIRVPVLSDEQREEIRNKYLQLTCPGRERIPQLAVEYGVSNAEIGRILRRRERCYDDRCASRAIAGVVGGRNSAAKFTPEEHERRSAVRGQITLQRYGSEYYSALGRLSARRRQERLAQAV